MLKFWLHPRTLVYSLSVFTSFNYIGFNQTTLEPHLRSFNLSGFLLGMLFALSGTVYALTAPAWGWLCDKKCNPLSLSLMGCSINIFSLLLIGPAPFFPIGPQIWIVIISLIFMGLGLGCKLVCAFTGTLQDTVNRGLPPDLSTYGLVSSMIASSQSLGAFIGPSIGGYLYDELGFRKASMTLMVLEIVLIILLIISICNKKNWIKTAEVTMKNETTKNGKKSLSNGYIAKEEYFEKASIKTISNKTFLIDVFIKMGTEKIFLPFEEEHDVSSTPLCFP
ncbi:MFS-type transporter SLC18B1 [Caerostris extrusa]|uniref:MFS-type transporter SLC18B1 n=1 Tax=Caerostris extrusa TaxID=172846 RepID=A0AAV4T0T3_CAEEX|nr:MFS-type transporter SLC18B1 [Caerostris extrusa]